METTLKRSSPLMAAALYLATIAVYADMYITQPLLPLLSVTYGIAPAIAGMSISMVVIAIAVTSSMYGPLGDRYGRKQVMVVSGLLLALPTLACAFAPSFEWLLLFRALQGACIPGITAVSVAYIGEQFDSQRLGPLVGSLISASVAGGLVGRVGSGMLAEWFSWHAPFVVFAALTALSAGLMWLVLPDSIPGRQIGWVSAYRHMLIHLRNPSLLGAFLIGATLFFGFIGIFTYLPYHLAGPPYQLSTGVIASIYVVYLAGVIVSPIAGRLSARLSRRRIMAFGLVIAICGMLITLFSALPVIILGLVVLCFGMFTAQATAPAYVNASATQQKGSANALYLSFYYIGATFGSVLPGFAWQMVGWSGVVLCCVVALLLALLADWKLCR